MDEAKFLDELDALIEKFQYGTVLQTEVEGNRITIMTRTNEVYELTLEKM